jgi:hypothetical protein
MIEYYGVASMSEAVRENLEQAKTAPESLRTSPAAWPSHHNQRDSIG